MDSAEYVKLAKVEDRMWYFRSLHRHAREELDRGISSVPTGDIIDAGCGTGGFIKKIIGRYPDRDVIGLDYSELACDFARERTGVRIEVGSITGLPFPAHACAVVTALDVVVQVEEPRIAFEEFFRVLKPGGLLIVNTPAYRWLRSYHDITCQTFHRYTRKELSTLAVSAGFTVELATHWNLLTMPLIVARRKVFRRAADTSDVNLFPPFIDAALNGAMLAERAWIRRLGPLPVGTSVFLVARKPDAGVNLGFMR